MVSRFQWPPPANDVRGQFNVSLVQRLHRVLAIEAAQAGLSLNALVSQKLAKGTHPFND